MDTIIEVVFKTRAGNKSRKLSTPTKLTAEQVKNFYKKFCRRNNCEFKLMQAATDKLIPLDYYMSDGDFYDSKALRYAEHYGILTYKVKNNIMIYNQNYYNKEFINGKWIENPCTYQRTIDLDDGLEKSKRLQRLQKDGWDNV